MKSLVKKLWQDESAQGMLEYMLILVVVVVIGFIFKEQLQDIVRNKLNDISGQISGFQ